MFNGIVRSPYVFKDLLVSVLLSVIFLSGYVHAKEQSTVNEEYIVREMSILGADVVERKLNAVAEKGWSIVDCNIENGKLLCIFKRLK